MLPTEESPGTLILFSRDYVHSVGASFGKKTPE